MTNSKQDSATALRNEFAELKPILNMHEAISEQQGKLAFIELQLNVLNTRTVELERQRNGLANVVKEHEAELTAMKERPLLHRLLSIIEIQDKIELLECAQNALTDCTMHLDRYQVEIKPISERSDNLRWQIDNQKEELRAILSKKDTCLALVLLRAAMIKDELLILAMSKSNKRANTTPTVLPISGQNLVSDFLPH